MIASIALQRAKEITDAIMSDDVYEISIEKGGAKIELRGTKDAVTALLAEMLFRAPVGQRASRQELS